MKKGSLILPIAFLATIGFSEAIAAQHVEEGHIIKHTHGPPRNDRIIIRDRHYNPKNHVHNLFCENNKA